MKKLKCIKCSLYFKDRNDLADVGVNKELCFNCRFIWFCLSATLQSLNNNPLMRKPLNREVVLHLDDVRIRRTKTKETNVYNLPKK